jgi:hypothetical protein
LFGHIDYPATAFADLLEQFVATDAITGFLGGHGRETDGSTWAGCRAFEEGTGGFTGLKQFLDALTQGGVIGTGLVKISGALTGRQPPGSTKDNHFAIRRFNHERSSYSAIQCEKPEQKAQGILRELIRRG